MAGTDIVVLDESAVADILMGKEVAFAAQYEDPAEVQRQIVARILSAETAEDVLRPQNTVSAEDILGVPLHVTNVRWMQSRVKDAAIPVFALIEATRGDDGAAVIVSCGALQVMASCLRLAQLGAIPFDAIFVQKDTPTASGYYPIWMENVPTPAVTS